jgi:hypothetical protein
MALPQRVTLGWRFSSLPADNKAWISKERWAGRIVFSIRRADARGDER